MRNYDLDQLAEMLVDAFLSETHLNKQVLVPKCRALIRTMVDLKNVPKNYNQYVKPNKNADRLRALEQRGAEIKYWLNIVRTLDPENMQKYYDGSEAMLIEKGFIISNNPK